MKVTRVEVSDYIGMNGTLPLENGVTTLTGANAAGKTMFTNVVPGILYNELVLKAGATVGFGWEADNTPGSMLLTRQANKTLWRGTVDGVSAEHNTIRAAQRWMREHFPIPQSVFTTVNYLAAFRSGVMLGGRPAERMSLLADIVGLQIFDDLRQGVNKLAQSANVTIALRDRILASLEELVDDEQDNIPLLDLTGITKQLSSKRSNLKAEALRLAEVLDEARPFGNEPIKSLEKAASLAPERNKAWDQWEEFRAAGGMPKNVPTESEYNAAMCALNMSNALLPILKGKLKKVGDVERHRNALATIDAQLSAINDQIEHLRGHSGNVCPTCNSKINGKKLIAGLINAITVLQENKIATTEKVRVAKLTDQYQKILVEFETNTKDVLTVFDRADDIVARYEAAQKIQNKWQDKPPNKPDNPRIDIDEINAELRLRRKGYGLLDEDDKRYRVLAEKYKSASGVLNVVNDTIESQSDRQSNNRRISKLQAELAELPNSNDAELLITLVKSLDNKHARNKYLELVAEHWINTLNELAGSFFDYKMEFAWTAGKLVANRKSGASDTALLSGREGRMFLLLNALAIQRCLPPGKRLRTLFLDEIEAGSDSTNRSLFVEVIPTLMNDFDNILVVTPLPKAEFYVEGPRYRVTKDKTLSREE